MGIVVLPNTFTAHTDAVAAEVMGNYNAILAVLNGNVDQENLAAAITSALFSPGDLKPTARAAAPEGWLLCDGSAVSRSTYAKLFAAIGTAYGVGNGSTTFNIPDLRGRTLFGVDGSAGRLSANDTLGKSGGHRLMPAHSHPHNISTQDAQHPHQHSTGASLSIGLQGGFIVLDLLRASGGGHLTDVGGLNPHSHGISGGIGNEGGGPSGGDDRMPPFQIGNWLVKI